MTYRVAIIGAGKLGATHLRHWSRIPNAEVVSLLDTRVESAHGLSTDGTGTPAVFDDFGDLIAQSMPDIVDICTPTSSHRDYVERAAFAGLAVFVEKPLAHTLADCEAIVSAIEKTGVPLMAGHVVRFFPAYARAREIVQSGGVGTPAAIRMSRLAGFPSRGQGAGWYANAAESGGVVLDAMIHDFDWLRWCFGPVRHVYARGLIDDHACAGKLDYALVTLRLECGAIAHVEGSWAHTGPLVTSFEVAGDAGLVEHDSRKETVFGLAARENGAAAVQTASPLAADDDPYFLELAAFVSALSEGAAPPVTVSDAAAAVSISLAALESIRTNKAVAPK